MRIFGPMMTPLRFGCYVADVNGTRWPCEAMNLKANGSRTDASSQMSTCRNCGSDDAIDRRRNGFSADAASQMSRRWDRATVKRCVTEAKNLARMPLCGC